MSLTFLACFLSAFFQFSFFVVQAILDDIDSLFHLNQNAITDCYRIYTLLCQTVTGAISGAKFINESQRGTGFSDMDAGM